LQMVWMADSEARDGAGGGYGVGENHNLMATALVVLFLITKYVFCYKEYIIYYFSTIEGNS
jgi:hypothetical protein